MANTYRGYELIYPPEMISLWLSHEKTVKSYLVYRDPWDPYFMAYEIIPT